VAPEKPGLTLIGTIVGPATSLAMVKDPATQAVKRLREGEEASGWRLKTVTLRSIIVEKGEQSAVVGLPNRLDTSDKQAANDHLPVKDKKN
jgi:general secretion pathway protein N